MLTMPRGARPSVAFLAAGSVVIATWLALPPGPLRAFLLVGFDAAALGALCLGLWRHRPPAWKPWAVLVAAQTCSVGGFAYWYLYPTLTGVTLPLPSVADALFLSLYGFSSLAVAMMIRRERAGRDRRTVLEVLIVAVSIGSLSWVFLMAPYAHDTTISTGVRLLSLAYPAFDLLLFVLVARLVLSGATPTTAKWLLLAWSGCQLAGDAIYGFELLAGRWTLDSPVPSLWMAAFAFLGAAALHPSIRELSDPVVAEDLRRRSVVLRTALVVGCVSVLPLVLIVELIQGDVVGLPVITAGSFVVFVLALWRGAVTGTARRADTPAGRRSMFRLVAGFVVLTLLPLGLLAFTSVRLAEQALERDVLARVSTTASTSAALVERQMTGFGELVDAYAERRLLIAALADGNDGNFDRAGIARHLDQLHTGGEGVDGAFLADGSGRVIDVAPHLPGLIGEDLSDEDWYRGLRESDEHYVSSAYRTVASGTAGMTSVVAPIHDVETGRRLGFIGAVYDLAVVQELSTELADAHGVALRVTDQEGTVVAAPAGGDTSPVDIGADDRVVAALAGRSGVVTHGTGADTVLSAYEPVEGLGWTVTAEVPRDVAFASLDRLRTTVLAMAALLGQALLGGLVLLVRSLRQRREVERTLQESEAQTTAILHAAADAFVSVDSNGALIAWSGQAERLFGWRRDEVIGSTLDEVIGISDTLRPSELGRRNEAVVRHRDGTAFPVEIVMWGVGEGDDAVSSAFLHDISDRRRQEAEVAAARDQALEASRLKSEFLAVVSHEIRTPMNGVLGMTSLLLATDLTGEQREYAETVRDSGEGLLGLVNDVLDFSKAESGRMTLEVIDFSLRHVVRDVSDLLGVTAADKGVDLTSRIGAGVPLALRGDPGRLRQVLTNLVGNAIKFTAEGSVSLTVGAVAVSASEIVLRFEVIDTGIGIMPDDLERLFEAFAQADASTTREYGGTGLGLAISRQLVELLGGEIGVTSTPGEGSTFWFTATFAPGVPLRKLPAVELPAAPLPGHRSALVLVAEDNAVNQRIAARMLEKLGHRADVVANGAEAVEALKRVPYDLVLMDCQMPVMDGYTAVAAVREREGAGARTPVIAMTASAMEADRLRCLAAGMDDYVSKPVRLHDLAAAVNRWMPEPDEAGAEPAPSPGSSPAADQASGAVLDEAVIENLRQLGPGFVAQVVGLFRDGLPERVAALRAAAAESNASALAGLAHALRGTSGNVGGTEVASICARIEALAGDDLAAAVALVPDLERRIEVMSAALDRYVADPAPDPVR